MVKDCSGISAVGAGIKISILVETNQVQKFVSNIQHTFTYPQCSLCGERESNFRSNITHPPIFCSRLVTIIVHCIRTLFKIYIVVMKITIKDIATFYLKTILFKRKYCKFKFQS